MKHFSVMPGLAALAVCLVFHSCDALDSLFDPVPGHGRPRSAYLEGGGQPSSHDKPSDDGSTAVYVTGVEFPDGYDWRTDSLYGVINASVVLYRDDERILTIPAGASEQVSPDPDMHHFLAGDLYTEYSDASGTTVKRNGVRLFAYEGREVL